MKTREARSRKHCGRNTGDEASDDVVKGDGRALDVECVWNIKDNERVQQVPDSKKK